MSEVDRKEDRRVRRTKKLLTQALTQLMQKKQPSEITVKELTELADMNRGTFYLYYKDIYDMLTKVEDNLFETLHTIIKQHESDGLPSDILPMLKEVFIFVSENRDMCRVLLSPNGDMSFLHRLNELVRKKCRAFWVSQGMGDEVQYDYHYSFCVFGCAGLLRAWLGNDCRETPEDMACLAGQMLKSATLRQA